MPTTPTGSIETRGRSPLVDAPRRDRAGRGPGSEKARGAAADDSGDAGSIKAKRRTAVPKAGDDDSRDFSKALSRTLDRRDAVPEAKGTAGPAPGRNEGAGERAEPAQGEAKAADHESKRPSASDTSDEAPADTVNGEKADEAGGEQPTVVAEPAAEPPFAAAGAAAVTLAPAAKPRGGAAHNAARAGEGVAAASKPTGADVDAPPTGSQASQSKSSQGGSEAGAAGLVEIKPGTDAPAPAGSVSADGTAAAAPGTGEANAQNSAARGTERSNQATNGGDSAGAVPPTGSPAASGLDPGAASTSPLPAGHATGPGPSFASGLGIGAEKGVGPSGGAESAASPPGQSATTARAQGDGEMSQLESLVARGLSASLAQRGGTLTMRLTPESLGAMRIQMDVQHGVVNVSMDVANPRAHRLLMESIDTLRTSLEARGLAVEKIGVNLTPGSLGPSGIGGAGTASHTGNGNPGGGSSGTGDQNAQRQDANGQGFADHDAGDGRSRSWLGGDQREEHRRPGGAAAHASDRTDAESESFGGLWQRLRLGVDTRV